MPRSTAHCRSAGRHQPRTAPHPHRPCECSPALAHARPRTPYVPCAGSRQTFRSTCNPPSSPSSLYRAALSHRAIGPSHSGLSHCSGRGCEDDKRSRSTVQFLAGGAPPRQPPISPSELAGSVHMPPYVAPVPPHVRPASVSPANAGQKVIHDLHTICLRNRRTDPLTRTAGRRLPCPLPTQFQRAAFPLHWKTGLCARESALCSRPGPAAF